MENLDFNSMRPPSRLSAAARIGDIHRIKNFLAGEEPNTNDNRGWTCLHEAAAHGHHEIVRILLEDARVEPDVATHMGETSLMLAAKKDHESVIRALFDKGANLNFCDASGKTSLMAAAESGSLIAAEVLLSLGADFTAANVSDWTALHFAADAGRTDIALLLMRQPEVDINAADRDGLTPLFLATQHGAVGIVKAILAMAKERDILDEVVNTRSTDGSGVTPIFLGAQEGFLEIVECLVEAGASIEPFLDVNGENAPECVLPIQSAIEKNHLEIVRYLAQKMTWQPFNSAAPTPFHFAVMWNNPESLQVLLQYAPPHVDLSNLYMPDLIDAEGVLVSSNFRIQLGYTHLDVLGTAVYFENVTMVRLLLEKGLSANPTSPKVFPSLLLALGGSNKSLALAKILLEYGADPTIYHPEVKGNLALLNCLDNQLLIMTLISYGADVDSLFHPLPVKPFVYQFSMNENDIEPSLSLLRIMEGNGQTTLTHLASSSKRRFQLLKFLVPLVFTIPMIEYAKYKRLLKGADWNCLQSWTKWPPTLMQLCRRKIRQTVATDNWSRARVNSTHLQHDDEQPRTSSENKLPQDLSYRDKVENLSLPPFLMDFLTHAEDVKALEEEKRRGERKSRSQFRSR